MKKKKKKRIGRKSKVTQSKQTTEHIIIKMEKKLRKWQRKSR